MKTKAAIATNAGCILLPLLTCGAGAHAQSWQPPALISGKYEAFSGALALDDGGNASSVWSRIAATGFNNTYPVEASTRPATGSWSMPAKLQVQSATNWINRDTPVVHSTAAGMMTAVWGGSDAIWAADKPAGGAWGAPQKIGPGQATEFGGLLSVIVFAMDRAGDAVVTWSTADYYSHNPIYAVTRAAGRSWSTPQILVPAGTVIPDDASVGAGGAAVIAWESLSFVQSGEHGSYNYVPHASSAAAPGAAWLDSGPLYPAQNYAYNLRVAVDASGAAGLIASPSDANGANGVLAALTQANSGAAWSSPVTIAPAGSALASKLGTDDAGDATILTDVSSGPNAGFCAVQGSLTTNHWSAPVALLSGGQVELSAVLDVAANGNAVAGVTFGDTYIDKIAGITRRGPAGTWSAPVLLSGKSTGASVTDAATNPAAQAVVSWTNNIQGAPYEQLYANDFH